jgi:SAM-dependent methyltransferase
MIALPTADDAPPQLKSQQGSKLAEQLVEFANEAFVYAGGTGKGNASEEENEIRRIVSPKAFFADVTPPSLHPLHLKNTRVAQGPEQILSLLPKGGVCVEIGSRTGAFSGQIISILEPAKLHLCDRDFNSFDESHFALSRSEGVVELHSGDAAEHLAAQPDKHFDLIYLHAGRSYSETARALEQAARKLTDKGCIICSNYMTYSPIEGTKCGVMRAVNEFCHIGGFEIISLALDPLGYHDVALRRSPSLATAGPPGSALLDVPDPLTFLPDVWQYLIDKYEITSVLDVGAGPGWSTKWFADRGIYTLGVEGWQDALEKSQCRGNIVAHDYSAGSYVPSMLLDLAWCAGFVEQIEEDYIPHFMASFRSCRHVCLTHAEAGEEGYHYVNCQPTEYWIDKMSEYGFDCDSAETARLRATDKYKAPRGRRTLTFFKRRN